MRSVRSNFTIAAIAMLAASFLIAGSSAQGPGTTATREKPITIQAQAFGQAQQLGRTFGVNIIIKEYSSADDQKALLEAFSAKQNEGLVNALSKMECETKKTTLNQMNYHVNWNVQKTLLSEQPSADSAPPPPTGGRLRGRLKQKVVAKKTGEFKELMEGIASLVKSYTEVPPEQLQSAFKQAAFSPGQGDIAGSIQIQMANLLQRGDSLTIWIDQGALLFRKIAIVSSYDQKPLTATANYAMLPSGEVYMAQAIVNYPSKEVVVEIDNLNYQGSR